MAGYSGTPLVKKLGIKVDDRVTFSGAPEGFEQSLGGELPAGVEIRPAARGRLDVIVFFAKRRSELERRIDRLGAAIHPAGGLWIAWPKRASGVPTDITEDTVREVGLPLGLVDNKVCAIDETWSALRLVWRVENR